jgi:DNA-binding NarL/FixJ family response regulator
MNPVHLLLVSDELITRSALRELLSIEGEFKVVGEAGVTTAIDEAVNQHPDVVVVCAEVTQPGSAELISSLRIAAPEIGIVVLGRETHHSYVGVLLVAGALGYILLKTAPMELFAAIHAASIGQRHIDSELNKEFFEVLARQANSGTKLLSRREQEVLRMTAYGYTPKEMASTLNISKKSIETYRQRTQVKLGLRTRAQIVRYALQTGIFHDEIGRAS